MPSPVGIAADVYSLTESEYTLLSPPLLSNRFFRLPSSRLSVVFDAKTVNSLEVAGIVSDEGRVFVHRRGRNQDVEIADQLATLAQNAADPASDSAGSTRELDLPKRRKETLAIRSFAVALQKFKDAYH